MTRPAWRKSSHSGPEQGDCVEVADLTQWRKSSHSGTQQGDCVEVAGLSSSVGIRDSKNPHLGHLTLTSEAFAALLARAKRDELNL